MKAMIEKYLYDLGFTNIEWNVGRLGYYVMAQSPYGSKQCINIGEFVNEVIRNER